MILNVALNYGGRPEIINAVKKIAKLIKENKIQIEDIDEN
jgi:undecaprenyl diphosphate synthase